VHARKAYMGVGYSSTYSNHDARWERSVSRPAHLLPGIETAVPSRTLDGSHNRPARFGQEINLLSLWGIEPRFLGRAAHSILTIAVVGIRLPHVVLYDCNSSSFITMIKQKLRKYLWQILFITPILCFLSFTVESIVCIHGVVEAGTNQCLWSISHTTDNGHYNTDITNGIKQTCDLITSDSSVHHKWHKIYKDLSNYIRHTYDPSQRLGRHFTLF
jgi:hypothetical protein